MHIHTKLTTAALMGFVLIAAAACGGGSDGLTKMEEEALQEQVEAAEEAKRRAEEAAAEEERKRKLAEEAAAEEERKRKEAEAEAEAERKKAEEAEVAEETAEEAQQEAQKQQEQLQEQLTEAQQAELRARASSFGTELDLGDGIATSADATVSWQRGESLTFRPGGVTFERGSAAPSVPGGWSSASFTGQTGTATELVDETVHLYTNIQAPGSRAFWKVYGLNEAMTDTLASLARGSSATPNADTDDTTDGHQYTELTVNGSLNGASGNFTCACGGTVGSETDGIDSHVTFAQGEPTFVAVTSWTFEPSSIANGYRVNMDDAYLYFGIWSSIPDNITGTYNFRYIAGGGAESGSDLGNFNALTGSATFRGGAVGRYVTQGQVGGQNAKIGSFTATATLNADFGGGEAGTLSGSITDFREDGSPLAGWRVTLGSATNVGAAATIADAGVAATAGGTVANIGGLSVGGSWSATFHGSDNEGVSELTDTAEYPPTQYPPVDLAGVTGWFDAIGTGANDASLAGAFGAVCTTGTMCAR